MAAIVEMAVMVTDKAKLERDKNTITLEAVPPGQHDTKINPTLKKGVKSNALPNSHPKKGIIVYCKNKPVRTQLGVWVTPRKSIHCMVKPIPNIIPDRPRVIQFPENHEKMGG